MRCLSNFGKSTLIAALLASNIALVAAVNCAPADDDGSPLTDSSQTPAGDFVTCTYQGAGPCTYFPSDGSFSSGASTCPQGLPQGDAAPDPGATTTTPVATDTPTSTPTSTSTSAVETITTSTSVSETSIATTPSTTTTQPPPTTRTMTQTEDAPPATVTSPTSTPQASSLGVFTASSPSIITATTVVIVSALLGLPNLLGIAYACVFV